MFSSALRRVGDVAVLECHGELDVACKHDLRHALADAGPLAVVDLTAVDFLDSSAIGVLLRAHRRGSVMAVAASGGVPARVLGMMGLEEILHVHTTVAAAVASVEERAAAMGFRAGAET